MEKILTGKMEKVVGKSVIRPDAGEKVLGRSKYAADYTPPGMLHAVTVRAPWAFLENLRVDVSRARTFPGVACVAVAADIPGTNIVPLVFQDQPFLAETRALFHGEAVAVVAAETLFEALNAADTVDVTGTQSTPCIDPESALKPDAPRLHGEDNIFKSYDIRRGDLEAAFRRSDVVVDREYRTPHQEHAYLETQGMLAEPDDTGGIRITGTMQCPFYVQDAVAAILDLPKHLVTVVQCATGGGFGGKEDVPSIVAGHAALLAWKTRRPVRMIYSREEDIRTMSKRHPSISRIRIGADSSGKLLAADVDYTLNGGAYATLSPIVLWRGAVHAAGPYNWEAVNIESRAVATNTVPNGAFRGFGQPQVTFAIESALDELAELLDMDPLEIRRKNIIGLGDLTATGHEIDSSCGMSEALEQAADRIGWTEKWKKKPVTPPSKNSDPVRGIGCSTTFYGLGLGAGGKHLARAGAFVQVEDDGTVRVYIGNTEMGQGARSVIGQIAAETLDAPFESVYVGRADTSRVPDSGPTVASRTTVMSGGAVMDACRKIRRALVTAAAILLDCDELVIESEVDRFFNRTIPGQSVSYTDTVKKAKFLRLPLTATGWFVSPDTNFGDDGQGNAYMTYVWSANIVEVEVDPGTLETRVLHHVAAHDVGRAINPREVAAQIQGGALQGLGYALQENLTLDGEGRILNAGFSGYLLPTAADAPLITPIIVEDPFREGPFGAKGIGEPPLIGVAPAVANAVDNALGVRVRKLPLSPEHILKSLMEMESES